MRWWIIPARLCCLGQFTGWAVLLICFPRAWEELLASTPRVWELGESSSRKSSTCFWRSNLDLLLVEFVICMSVLLWDKNYDDSPSLPSSTDISIKQALRKSLLIESNHRSCGIVGHSRVLETRIWFHSSQAASGYLLLSRLLPSWLSWDTPSGEPPRGPPRPERAHLCATPAPCFPLLGQFASPAFPLWDSGAWGQRLCPLHPCICREQPLSGHSTDWPHLIHEWRI